MNREARAARPPFQPRKIRNGFRIFRVHPCNPWGWLVGSGRKPLRRLHLLAMCFRMPTTCWQRWNEAPSPLQGSADPGRTRPAAGVRSADRGVWTPLFDFVCQIERKGRPTRARWRNGTPEYAAASKEAQVVSPLYASMSVRFGTGPLVERPFLSVSHRKSRNGVQEVKATPLYLS